MQIYVKQAVPWLQGHTLGVMRRKLLLVVSGPAKSGQKIWKQTSMCENTENTVPELKSGCQ